MLNYHLPSNMQMQLPDEMNRLAAPASLSLRAVLDDKSKLLNVN